MGGGRVNRGEMRGRGYTLRLNCFPDGSLMAGFIVEGNTMIVYLRSYLFCLVESVATKYV